MRTIQLEIPDNLANRLAPHEDHLVELLELGLDTWQKEGEPHPETERERVRRVLSAAENITLPDEDAAQLPYVRRTPVKITGKPVSEIAIEQRGPR
jgi:hypothetical protein